MLCMAATWSLRSTSVTVLQYRASRLDALSSLRHRCSNVRVYALRAEFLVRGMSVYIRLYKGIDLRIWVYAPLGAAPAEAETR